MMLWQLAAACGGLAGSGIGAAVSLPLVWPFAHRPLEARLLGGVALSLAAGMALVSARLAGWLPAGPGTDHLVNVIGLLGYPLLIVYVRAETGGRAWPVRAVALWVPAGAYLLVALLRGPAQGVPFVALLPLILGYTALALRTWWRAPARHTLERPRLVRVEWVLAFTVLLNLAQVARFAWRQHEQLHGLVPLVAGAGFVGLVALLVHRTLCWWPRPGAPRSSRSGLQEAAGRALLERALAAVEGARMFADPELSLPALASRIGASAHQLSEALNQYGGQSFHDLVNRCRVADARAQLRDPSSDRFAIDGIGRSSGFRSRSAFYAAFRRSEGITPSEYRARCRAAATSPGPIPPRRT